MDLLNAITLEYQKEIDDIKAKQQKQISEIENKILLKRQEDLQNYNKKKKREIELDTKRKVDKYRRDARHQLSSLQEKLVEEVFEQLQEELSALTFEEVESLIEEELAKHSLKPRIEVSSKIFKPAKEKYGQQYQVIESTTIKSGFKLIYDKYDINYDMEERLVYQKESILRKIHHLLFNGDIHYEV